MMDIFVVDAKIEHVLAIEMPYLELGQEGGKTNNIIHGINRKEAKAQAFTHV